MLSFTVMSNVVEQSRPKDVEFQGGSDSDSAGVKANRLTCGRSKTKRVEHFVRAATARCPHPGISSV